MRKIGFIGAGNMASSLIGGVIANAYPCEQISAYDLNQQTLQSVCTQFNIQAAKDLNELLETADIIVLAVKPQVLKTVCLEIKENLQQQLIISIAAGIRASSINDWLGGQQAIVRCMPNTPALLRLGASGLFANALVSEQQRYSAEQIIGAVGLCVWVQDESDIDAVTAISGSGPAYFFLFIEALQKAGEKLGLSPEIAYQLATQTGLGAAQMAMQNQDLELLRKNVTSKGGTTEQALLSFAHDDLESIVARAADAAFKRSQELSKSLAE